MRFSRKLQDTATHAVHRARQELKHPIGKAVAVVLLVLLGAAGWYTYHTISNPLAINAPPPVITIPRSTMSDASSGGVISSARRTASTTC